MQQFGWKRFIFLVFGHRRVLDHIFGQKVHNCVFWNVLNTERLCHCCCSCLDPRCSHLGQSEMIEFFKLKLNNSEIILKCLETMDTSYGNVSKNICLIVDQSTSLIAWSTPLETGGGWWWWPCTPLSTCLSMMTMMTMVTMTILMKIGPRWPWWQ